jgi:hypothetical protein
MAKNGANWYYWYTKKLIYYGNGKIQTITKGAATRIAGKHYGHTTAFIAGFI